MPAATNIRTEGGLLPADLLARIRNRDPQLPGLKPVDYGLAPGENINEAVSRSWSRLTSLWHGFAAVRNKAAGDQPMTGDTRSRWLLPLFQELGYGKLEPTQAVQIGNSSFPISHRWESVPIHLLGCGLLLDKRAPGVAGAAGANPHGLLQSFLNQSEDHLWGIVSNGLTLRLLRDNRTLTRQAYLEFDLEEILDTEAYADFALLWLVAHATRFDAPKPADCLAEQWSKTAAEIGTRALDHLRQGVEKAINHLGTGFLAHQDNGRLRDRLQSGELSRDDFKRQLLRTVYRLLFLLVAEDRDLLLRPDATAEARKRFRNHYALARLRRLALRHAGSAHGDAWVQFMVLIRLLGTDTGCPGLGLPALGSMLFAGQACPDLDTAALANQHFFPTLRALCTVTDGSIRRPVDFRLLGAEELGSVYESLLELVPQLDVSARIFTLATAAGNERKTSGSYYTPDSLVQCLLDSALEPVMDEAIKGKRGEEAAAAILKLKVCDPAVGSGHFLVAAAHRLAKRVAALRSGDDEPSPAATRAALREVIGHCLYGVDINPMSAELCKVSLWLEALEPGKPLGFLDHHIRVGNSLLGTTPELIAAGLPDDAFTPIEGDDRAACSELKKRNKREREGLRDLFIAEDEAIRDHLRQTAAALEQMDDSRLEAVKRKEAAFRDAEFNYDAQRARILADLWCAAFVIRKRFPTSGGPVPAPPPATPAGPTPASATDDLFGHEATPSTVTPAKKTGDTRQDSTIDPIGISTQHLRDYAQERPLPGGVVEEAEALAKQYQFFHWHLVFPEVFEHAGFDLILGNPPWVRQEMLKPIKQLLPKFRSFTSTADSSVYFLELGVQTCRPLGRVAMLTPNKWFRANYAENLRKVLRDSCRIDIIIDFGHSRSLFPDADTFPAAVVLQPTASPVSDSVTARFLQAHDSDRERHSLPELIRSRAVRVPHSNLRPDRWHLEGSGASDLLNRLMATGQPLEPLLRRPILSGLKTGFNDAFYVETPLRNAMLTADVTSGPLFKRFFRGRDVKRWVPVWDEQWHIVIPSSQNRTWPWSNAPNEVEAEIVFAETYPSIYAHLKQFEQKLRARQDKGRYWWELRACDYYEDFEEPKIVVQCIAYYSQFAFDEQGHYVNNKAIVIPTDDLYLLAVLNSRITWWIVNRTFQHMKDDGLSVDVQFLRRLPVPEVDAERRQRIEQTVQALMAARAPVTTFGLEAELDELVTNAFGLSQAEKSVLLASLPPRDPVQVAKDQAGTAGPLPIEHVTSAPLVFPAEPRVAASRPDFYVAQVILWLLKQSGGRCERVRLARAFALLSRPDWLVEQATEEQKAIAAQWRRGFNETGYAGLFAQVLRPMLGAEILLRREGNAIFAVLAQSERVVARPWIALDTQLALAVLDSLPPSILSSTPLEQARQEAETLFMTG